MEKLKDKVREVFSSFGFILKGMVLSNKNLKSNGALIHHSGSGHLCKDARPLPGAQQEGRPSL